jgi:excinuclease ABC subunit B
MINDDIDRLRHSATRAVLERNDVIVVASVSCIYGIGSPQDYMDMHFIVEEGMRTKRDDLLKRLVELQYERTDADLKRGSFRARGDVIEVYPSFSLNKCLRIELFGDDVDRITEFDPLTGTKLNRFEKFAIFPNSHWITPRDRLEPALKNIEEELDERIRHFKDLGLEVEAQRIEQRTRFDLEMLREFGYCHGIENYSRHLSGRASGEPPFTLLDYFNGEFIVVIDESHATVPQIGGMYEGDRARKENLVRFGFRLPSAMDNRPLKFTEFEHRVKQVVYVSATPGPYELEKSKGRITEQIIRPTGLTDPEMAIKPARGQVDNLLEEIKSRTSKGDRVLVTTLTKKTAEALTEYYTDLGIQARYMHSDVKTLERVELIRDLRKGEFDVLVGVNLLREGLDLPEVSLVAILDADKEGFLRSERALIQTAGRAARNVNGKVILYADSITGSMQRAIEETDRRRKKQAEYNEKMGITPETVKSNIKDILSSIYESDYWTVPAETKEEQVPYVLDEKELLVLEEQMREAAERLDFERAAELRDKISTVRKKMIEGIADAV